MAGLAARRYDQQFDDSYESESNVVLDAPTSFHRVATDEEADAAFAYVISKHIKALEMLAEYDKN